MSSKNRRQRQSVIELRKRLADLEKQEREDHRMISASFSRQVSYQGPVPPPEMLKQFEDVVPGSAAQLISTFVKQTEHRMNLENRVIDGDQKRSWGGLACGFVIAMFGLYISWCVIEKGHVVTGSALAGGTLVSLVSVFVIGRKSQSKERIEKAKLNP